MRMLGKGATAKRSLGGVRARAHRDSDYGAQDLVFDSCLLLNLVFDMTNLSAENRGFANLVRKNFSASGVRCLVRQRCG
jgi:hypothetical protein